MFSPTQSLEDECGLLSPGLRELRLAENRLTVESLSPLQTLTELRLLSLRDNPLLSETAAAAQGVVVGGSSATKATRSDGERAALLSRVLQAAGKKLVELELVLVGRDRRREGRSASASCGSVIAVGRRLIPGAGSAFPLSVS